MTPFPAGADEKIQISIRAGTSAFWEGPFIQSANGECSDKSCFTYDLVLEDTGHRLRIGIDRPEIGDVFTATIIAPSGEHAGSISPGTDLYSAELLVEDPQPGTWRIDVRAEDVTESTFRMRAKLESRKPPIRSTRGNALPNLQVLPPHDAFFLMPVSNGSTGGEPLSIDLQGAASCHPEEYVEERAARCLRLAFGIRNTGSGPLALFTGGQVGPDQELIQRIYRTEKVFFERPAGRARLHKTHGHYHHHDAVALQIYRVIDDKKGKLEPAGDKHFKGFAHRDELLRDWFHFYPTWTKVGFGLLPGWADIYEWDRPGNYISFGENGDGRYVLRMWADPVGGILESNELDNAGYTYLRVTGSQVHLLEAGRGTDPWDPCKILVGFGGHRDPPSQHPRPRSCPPDTL